MCSAQTAGACLPGVLTETRSPDATSTSSMMNSWLPGARMATEFHVSSTCAPWRHVSTTKLPTSSVPSIEALTTAYFKMGDSVANVFLPLRMYVGPSFLAVDSGLPPLDGLPVADAVAMLWVS